MLPLRRNLKNNGKTTNGEKDFGHFSTVFVNWFVSKERLSIQLINDTRVVTKQHQIIGPMVTYFIGQPPWAAITSSICFIIRIVSFIATMIL